LTVHQWRDAITFWTKKFEIETPHHLFQTHRTFLFQFLLSQPSLSTVHKHDEFQAIFGRTKPIADQEFYERRSNLHFSCGPSMGDSSTLDAEVIPAPPAPPKREAEAASSAATQDGEQKKRKRHHHSQEG
jgi:hypothetical protein